MTAPLMRTAVPRSNPEFDISNYYTPLSDDPDTSYIDISRMRGNPRSTWVNPKSGSKRAVRPRRRKAFTYTTRQKILLRSEDGKFLPGPLPSLGRRDKRLDTIIRLSQSKIDILQNKLLQLKKALKTRGELIPHVKIILMSQLIRANFLHDSVLPYVRCHKGWCVIVRPPSTGALFRLIDLMIHCLSTALVDPWLSTFMRSDIFKEVNQNL